MSPTTCSRCGAKLAPDDQFCHSCGSTAILERTGPELTPSTGPGSASGWDRTLARLKDATADQFEIERELGRGGMAAVYLANEIELSRLVAIKVMSPGLLMDDSMVERFRQEAITLANLNHSHIVPIYAVREVEDLHFFVMKYIEGRPLNDLIDRTTPMSIPVIRSILFQVGSALASAHRRGIIHRDIKPANILLEVDGNAIVTDFGIAKVAEMPGHTKTGAMVGTPAYMSPEQCVGAELTVASDQYSLGIVAYEMLTGSPPFTGPTLAVMHAHTEKPPKSIRDIRPDCPVELESAILRMLEKDPAKRWKSTTQAVAAAGGVPLTEDDPTRTALITLASAGQQHSIRRFPVSKGSRPTPKPATPTPAPPPVVAAAPIVPAVVAAITPAAPPVPPPPSESDKLRTPANKAGRSPRIAAVAGGVVLVAAVLLLVTRSHQTPTGAAPSPGTTGVVPLSPAPSVDASAPTVTPSNGAAPTAGSVASDKAKSISFAPRDTEVETGAQFRLRAIVHSENNAPMSGAGLRWRSLDSARAKVDSVSGTVTVGSVPGGVRIMASVGDVESSVGIRVRAAAQPVQTVAPGGGQSATHLDNPVAPVAPAPPPKSEVAAAKAPEASAAKTPTANELTSLVEACVAAFSSEKKDRILTAYGVSNGAADEKNRNELGSAADRKLRATLAVPAQVQSTGDQTATASFQLTFSYAPNAFANTKTSAGPYPFAMQLLRVNAGWQSTGCRTDAVMRLR